PLCATLFAYTTLFRAQSALRGYRLVGWVLTHAGVTTYVDACTPTARPVGAGAGSGCSQACACARDVRAAGRAQCCLASSATKVRLWRHRRSLPGVCGETAA